jgi:hypothetical protein
MAKTNQVSPKWHTDAEEWKKGSQLSLQASGSRVNIR